jgi:hypothetical protein
MGIHSTLRPTWQNRYLLCRFFALSARFIFYGESHTLITPIMWGNMLNMTKTWRLVFAADAIQLFPIDFRSISQIIFHTITCLQWCHHPGLTA